MYKIDKIDYEIIRLLMQDGRMPAAQIARRLGNVSQRAVQYRIERMLQERIFRISAILNPQALGFPIIADVFIEVETSAILDVARKLVEYDQITYVACSIGERDISVQVIAHNAQEVYTFATEVIGKIPGVRKTTTSIVPLTLKDIYDWRLPTSLIEPPVPASPQIEQTPEGYMP